MVLERSSNPHLVQGTCMFVSTRKRLWCSADVVFSSDRHNLRKILSAQWPRAHWEGSWAGCVEMQWLNDRQVVKIH